MTTHGQCTDECGHVASRKTWPPGPWTNEPDRVEFQHAGLQCLLHRGPRGAWCGYVGLPPSHPLHGKSYWDAADIDVHGGLTYADHCDGAICHIPAEGENEMLWWFGFDCSHGGDCVPGFLALPPEFRFDEPHAVYRDQAYVTRETKRLAEQLAEAANA